MSGFEIAGLILGAVPLTISALKQYKSAHEMLLKFKYKSLYVDRLIGALEEQEYYFEIEFGMVLRAAGFAQQDASTISGEYLRTTLLRNDVAKELREHLGSSFNLYRKALVRCGDSLGEVVRNIEGLVPGPPSGDLKELLRANERKEGKYEFKKRIKFSLKKDELDRRIAEIIEATSSLKRLRKTSASLYDNGMSSSRTIARFAFFLQRIHQNAESLYVAIARKLASGCHHEHGTRFYLEGQSAILQRKSLPIHFKLGIETVEAHMVERNPCHEVCIEVLENHPAEPNPQQQSEQSMTEVENLCLSLIQARQHSKVLKVFLSQHGRLSSCHMSIVSGRVAPSGSSTSDMISLEQILLQTSSDRPPGAKWNLIQRMNLSFSLASSLLQLYSTPWLSEPWTKRAIYFWRLRPSLQASDMALIFEPDRPFIVHSFPEPPVTRSPYKINAKHQLLNLGIILLEIGHESSFESWTSTHGYTLDLDRTYGSRYDAASEWLRDSQSNLVPSYYDVTARCIECTFQTGHGRPVPDWEDTDFRKSVCELVIKPLWSNCSTEII